MCVIPLSGRKSWGWPARSRASDSLRAWKKKTLSSAVPWMTRSLPMGWRLHVGEQGALGVGLRVLVGQAEEALRQVRVVVAPVRHRRHRHRGLEDVGAGEHGER